MSGLSTHNICKEDWLGPISYCGQRKFYESEDRIPHYEDLKQSLGIPMTELIFEYGVPEIAQIKKEVKETCPVKGAKESEAKDDNVKYSCDGAVLTRRPINILANRDRVRDIVFNTILAKGNELAEKLDGDNKRMMGEKLEDLTERIKYRLRKDIQEMYTLRVREIFYKLYEEFKEAIEHREQILLKEAERAKNEAVNVVRKSMEDELNEVIAILDNYHKVRFTFLKELSINEVNDKYLEKLNIYDQKWTVLVEKAKQTSANEQKRLLQCVQNVHKLNLLQTIALERHLANRMVEETALYFVERIERMREQIKKLYDSLQEVNKELNKGKLEIRSWECLLKNVVDQFQKFVNFVLQSVPGDAEYLLSLEKLLERRQKVFEERFVEVGLAAEEATPKPCWRRELDELSVTSDQLSALIHTITNAILCRGRVQQTAPELHIEPISVPQEIRTPSSDLPGVSLGTSSKSFSFTVETPLSTTITSGSSRPIHSDESFVTKKTFYLKKKPKLDTDEDNLLFKPRKSMTLLNTELPGEEELLNLVEKKREQLQSTTHENVIGEDFQQFRGDFLPIIYRNKEDLCKIVKNPDWDDTTLTLSPTTTPTTDSLYLSSTSMDIFKCDEEKIKFKASTMEKLTDDLVQKEMDLKFVGTERKPPPPDKEAFVQGRLLSILNLMKAHPRFHNVLVEP